MAFVINANLSDREEYQRIKDVGDGLLEAKGLNAYNIEIRPATQIEERAVAGKGLAPEKDSGDNFVSNTGTLVVYRTVTVDNPLLKEVEEAPSRVAEILVDRLERHVSSSGS